MARVTKEWCATCRDWVVPYVQDGVGFCPECGDTTKDLVNNVQTGPDFKDVPETVSRWRLVNKFSR